MVNIDTVYQRVLALANKEQRGYIPPVKFNLFANQAQMDIFEQYFYDRNQTARGPGNSTHYSDVDSILSEKISIFETETSNITGALPEDLYRLGSVIVQFGIGASTFEAKNISSKDWITISSSPLLKPTNERPIYIRSNNTIKVFGDNNIDLVTITPPTPVTVNYIKQPNKVEWGYDVIGEKALYNGSPNKTTHFQHHPSEETKLVIKILELAGVIIQDPGVVQYADGEDMKKYNKKNNKIWVY